MQLVLLLLCDSITRDQLGLAEMVQHASEGKAALRRAHTLARTVLLASVKGEQPTQSARRVRQNKIRGWDLFSKLTV